MAIFNPQYLTNPLASLNTAFGIPTCILNLGVGALGLIDSEILGNIAGAAEEGKAIARRAIAGVVNDMFSEMGILQYDAGTGKLALFSGSSKFGLDLGFLEKLAKIQGFLGGIEEFVNQGIDLYQELATCLGEFENYLNSTGPAPITGTGGVGGGSTDQYTNDYRAASLALARSQVESATNFIDQCNNLILNIGTVLLNREEEALEEIEEPIFRLVYGPPVSKQGLFILSEDGIYYDSQERLYNGKPIPSASDIGFIVNSEKWKLDHAPNLGGKGSIVSVEDLNKYVDTIFDINSIDNSPGLLEFYASDHFLNVLEGQKDKLVYDLSAQIGELEASGHAKDSAVVINTKQNINSTIFTFNSKINKRMKQIEVAVKAPDLFGSAEAFEPGEIPVNDFSFLSSINLDVALETQEGLVFGSGEVADVVLPIQPIYVTPQTAAAKVLVDPLVVPPVGLGAIIFNHSISGTATPALSLTDAIESRGITSIYNFLRPDGVLPDSLNFKTINCTNIGSKGNAQMIGNTPSLFLSGLGIPRFDGISRVNSADYKLSKTAGALRLPPTTEHQNIFYGVSGCSIECWLHIPNYGASSNPKEVSGGSISSPLLYPPTGEWADYNYYKILFANENTGGPLNIPDVSGLISSKSSDTVRGLLIGFSRDPVIFADVPLIPGSNTDPGANAASVDPNFFDTSNTIASSCFFIAPTLSMNSKAVEFVPKNENCITDGLHKLTVVDTVEISPYDTSGVKAMKDVSSTFIHLHMSFDVKEDKCSVYLDGNLMATSALSVTLGNQTGQTPMIPSFFKSDESFYYSNETVNQTTNVTLFDYGPQNDQYFTPWIVGSGWTEGMPINPTTFAGGFMGERHGLTSALNGHVGSFKIYSRPLNIKEVRKNYEAQKGFFKEIIT